MRPAPPRRGRGSCVTAATMRSRRVGSCLAVLVGLVLAAAGTPARADGVDQLLEQAAPEVQGAIGAQPLAARAALSSLLGRGIIDREHIAQALGKALLAPYVVDTLTALARVDGIPGAGETFERLLKAGDDGGVRGSSFEIQAAAALGDRVAAIGPVVDGNEVDLLLVDGTRVEVKNDAPDEQFKLSGSLANKAIKQLKKRGAFGDPVMLISNEPLAPETLADFEQTLGPLSEVVVLSGGRMWHQLARRPEARGQRVRRIAVGKLRRTLYRGRTRAANALRPAAKAVRPLDPRRIGAKLRGKARSGGQAAAR